MATHQDDTSQGFASLSWLDGIISFIFRLLAKLAEPFLAFGLIASAIDYGSHGQLMMAHHKILAAWVATQALALEGSGGVALSMSFEARAQHDLVKARIQCALALALLVAGGIMFFVELSSSIKGFSESAMPDWYIYTMSALRTLVSIGYIAVCRTAHHRFSGDAQDATQTAQTDDLATQIREAVRLEVHNVAQSLKNEVSTSVQVLVQNAQPSQIVAQCPAETVISEDIAAQPLLPAQRSAPRIVPAEPATLHTARIVPAEQPVLAQPALSFSACTEPVLAVVPVQAAAAAQDARSRVHSFVKARLGETGQMPTLEEVMDSCRVAKNTAVKYRRELQ